MRALMTLAFVATITPFPAAMAQTAATATAPKPLDNYTIQRLIVLNAKGEVLLERNEVGWMTPALRSTERKSIGDALAGLGAAIGIAIDRPRLAGVYSYMFDEVPADPAHAAVSFRTHYLARLRSGTPVQPADGKREYRWVPVAEVPKLIAMESLRTETMQILEAPDTLWGGTFLITFRDGKLVGSRTVEAPYRLRD